MGFYLAGLRLTSSVCFFVICGGKVSFSFSGCDLLLIIDLMVREGNLDTIILVSSDAGNEDDHAVGLITRFFLKGAGRPRTVREAENFLPLARSNPAVLEEMNNHFQDELMRCSRAQQLVIRLEARVRVSGTWPARERNLQGRRRSWRGSSISQRRRTRS